MLRQLCIAAIAAVMSHVLAAPGRISHQMRQVNIDYTKGIFYEDLARRYMVLVMDDGCYFWHLTHSEAEHGLSPTGIRQIEHAFVADLKDGVSLSPIHRSNFNHFAGSIVLKCKDVQSYLIHRGHGDHTDLSSINLQGTLPPNITIIHGIIG